MMFDRTRLGVLLLIGILLPIAGCTSSQVDTLEVTPNTINMAVGTTAQLTATGVYNHGTGPSTTQNLTDVVTWSTGSTDVANVSSTGLVTAVGPGVIQITASIKGFTGLLSAYSTITVPTPTTGGGGGGDITSLTITPGSQTLSAPGDQATYSVVGNTSSGTTVTLSGQIVCSSSTTDIATVIANGTTCVATAVAPGTATIEAQFTNADGTVASGTATLNVTGTSTTNTDITTITVIPGNQSVPQPGDTATFVAVGTTGAGTTVSLTGQVTWNTSAPQIATINAAGVATAVGAGSTTITAQFMNADKTTATGTAILSVTGSGTTNGDIVQVSIVPTNQTVAAPGDTATFAATGTTSSGVTKNLTNLVWSTSSPEIGTIDNTGVATAVGQGTTTISAEYTNSDSTVAVGTATFTVTASGSSNNDITAITIIPGSQSVAAPGETATFVAIGTTATGATVSMQGLATFSSSSASIAQVTNSATGVVTGLAAGTATITATYANADKTVATGSATFTVLTGATEQYTSVSVTPASQSIPEGGTSDFIALATSGTTGLIQNVTGGPGIQWTSSIPAVAIISTDGVATGKSAGTTTITALLDAGNGNVVSASADLTVTTGTPPEDILSLTIIPNSITVDNFYLTGQFLAIATYSTAPYVQDVTNSANTTWISTEPELFPVDTNSGGNSGASAGLVTAYASGGAVIVAETTNKDNTIQTATATFNCPEILPEPGVTNPSCYPNEPPAATLLATLTVYNEGLNTTDWLVTAPSATGTPDVIHCGPAWVPTAQQPGTGSVCTATYPMNITTPSGNPGIVITATGGQFGGWSYNCIPSDKLGNYLTGPNPWTAAGPNYCVLPFEGSYVYTDPVTLKSVVVTVDGLNQTVGAIFN